MAGLVYPIHITADADRYRYLYAALEELRLKHNERAGDLSGEANYFRQEWKIPHRKVLRGILELRKLVRTPGFVPTELVPDDPALVTLKGEGKADYKNADYKTLTGDNLDEVSGSLELDDPLEDYTTYVKSDPGSDMTVNANSVVVDRFTGTLDQWLYKDFGAAHFGETFEHLFKCTHTFTPSSSGYGCPWAVSNALGDTRDWWITSGQACAVFLNGYSGSVGLYHYEENTIDSWVSPVSTTPYWYAAERSGWEVLECRIYDDAYSNLLDTLVVDPPDARSYRYGFGLVGYNYGTARTLYAEIANLDLQEGGPSPSPSPTPTPSPSPSPSPPAGHVPYNLIIGSAA